MRIDIESKTRICLPSKVMRDIYDYITSNISDASGRILQVAPIWDGDAFLKQETH
jgi:hypothetical protein